MVEKIVFFVVPKIDEANSHPPGQGSILGDLEGWKIVIMANEKEKEVIPFAFAPATHNMIDFWPLEKVESFLSEESENEYEVILITELDLGLSAEKKSVIHRQFPDFNPKKQLDGLSLCIKAFSNPSITKALVYFSTEFNASESFQYLEKYAETGAHKIFSEARKLYQFHTPEHFKKIWDQVMQEWMAWESLWEQHPLEALFDFLGGEFGLTGLEIHELSRQPMIRDFIRKQLRMRKGEFEQWLKESPILRSSLVDAVKFMGTLQEERRYHHAKMTLIGLLLMAWLAYRHRFPKGSPKIDQLFVHAMADQFPVEPRHKHLVIHHNFLPDQSIGFFRQTMRNFFDLFCLLFMDQSVQAIGKNQCTIQKISLTGEGLEIKLKIQGRNLFLYSNQKLKALVDGRIPNSEHDVSHQLMKCWLAFHCCIEELDHSAKFCPTWSNLANFSIQPDGEEMISLVFSVPAATAFRFKTR